MNDFLTAVALAMVFEGIVYAAFPDAMKQMMIRVLATPAATLRLFGLAAAALGVAIVAAVRFAYFSS